MRFKFLLPLFLFSLLSDVCAQTSSFLGAGLGIAWNNSSAIPITGTHTVTLGLGIEYLIVAGGGGGGNGWHGGGGGGGGVRAGFTALSLSNYTIVVGAGGSGGGGNTTRGGSSSAFGIEAVGGGGGANGGSGNGGSGGSGGGASFVNGGTGTSNGGIGTSGQGYNGGNASYATNVYGSAAGGGGAGGAGGNSVQSSTAGAGGIGLTSTISGSALRYAAGGGGNGGTGGNGGGGSSGGQGTDGLGGGGGGQGGPSPGGRGGSGIVIFRYLGATSVTSGGSSTSISGTSWKLVQFSTTGSNALTISASESDLVATQSGVISGTGSLTFDSPGVLSLEASNTYTGYTFLKQGTLYLANSNALQNSTLDLRSADAGILGFTLAGANLYNIGGLSGSRNLSFGDNTLVIGSNNESTSYAGSLSGSGGIKKSGTGVLILSGGNTYTGTTTIHAGTLVVNGIHSGAGDVLVESGAKIQGSGTMYGATTLKNGGTIQPGNSVGKFIINNKLTLQGGGNYNFQIADSYGVSGTTGWDLIDVNGELEILATSSSKFNINLWSILNAVGDVSGNLTNFNPLEKYSWEIISADLISGFDVNKFIVNTSAINGTGGFQSSILATGSFTIEQSGNSLVLVYYPATDQTLDGVDNIIKTTTFTTNTISNRLNIKLGAIVDYLIVAGGGAGGSGKNSNTGGGGGGGGGGVLSGAIGLELSNYAITVGAGGAATTAQGNNGGNSVAFGLTALGGGGGAGEYLYWPGGSGGSGGGQGGNGGPKGTGIVGQGHDGGSANGGSGGGGGGAGSVGGNASGSSGGSGGSGRSSLITGTSITFGGGGGGATSSSGAGGVGGNGGGGGGGSSASRNGGAGSVNTGGGGGGAAGNSSGSTGTAGRGGSGVIIVRYKREEPLPNVGGAVSSFTGDGTNGENGAVYQVHSFNSTSTFNLSSIPSCAILSGSIQGSGDFSYSGPGVLALIAANTYSGSTTVYAGTLQVGNGGTTGSISNNSINVASGSTLVFNRSNTYTLGNANVISGSGNVEQAGDGTLDLGGITNHQAGTWKLSAGTISNGTLSSGNFSLTEGTITAVLAGTGALTKTGDGNVTLNGNNTYSGTTTISGGILVVNGTHSGTGTVTVASGATLKGSGTIGGATTIQSGGTLHPGNGIGTMTLSSGLTLSGGGNLNWQVNDATGTAGTNWSTVNVTGALTINATSGSKFNINIWSLLANGSNGAIANFKPTENTYSWTIFTAGSISGFAADKFQISTTPTNGTAGLICQYKAEGFNMSLSQDGKSLVLNYSPPTQQTIDGTNNGIESANFTTTTSAGSLTLDLGFFVDYLIVAGGGGGGGDNGGGGGGGGVLAGSNKQVSASSYAVSVGAGGAGGAVNVRGSNGGNSSLFGLTATGGGGGGGGNSGQMAQAGGSGGGGDGETSSRFGAIGTSIQGFKGGNGSTGGGGGGGGAGASGSSASGTNGGDGGMGVANSISGSTVYYAGGGGGGPENLINYISTGGNGGGGSGRLGVGIAGTANTGGGGGGAGWNGSTATGGAGGAGVAIIRYKGESLGTIGGSITSFVGDGIIGENGVTYRVHSFTSSGNFNMSGVDMGSRLRATLSGNVIGTGNLIFNGPGVLALSGTNSTYTGTTSITAGALNIRHASSLGATANGTTVSSGAALELQGGITVGAEALTLNNTGISNGGALRNISGDNTWGGTVTLGTTSRINSDAGTLTLNASNAITASNNNLTIGGTGNTAISGTITTDNGTLTKDGVGKLTLSGTNTYTGATTVSSGVLNIQNAQGTGTTAGGVTVASGAALELQGGITVGAEALTINNTGISSGGALRNISGDNTWGGTMTLSTNASRINSDAGTLTLTAANAITSSNINLTVGGAGNTAISGTITTGTGTLTKDGSGTLTLTAANTYTGATTISAGTLVLNRTGGTTIPVTNNVTVSGGTLRVSSDQTLNNLTVSSGSLIVDAGVTLTINGTYTGGGTIQNAGTIVVKGSSSFPGSTTTVSSMNNLEINRSTGVTLDKSLTITGVLTLTSGKLSLGNNDLTIGSSGSISGATSSKYIVTNGTGKLKMTLADQASQSYPVGNSTYNPITLTNKTGATDNFSVRVIDEVYTDGSSSGTPVSLARVKRTWDITKTTPSANSGSGVDLIFNWDPASHTSATLAIPKMYHYESGAWAKKSIIANTTYDVAAGTLSFTGYSGTFSPFAIMDDGTALPVNWLSFTAKQVHGAVELNWSTASEQNNSHFEVERSADALQFNKLGAVNAAANPRIKNDYQYLDQNPISGRSFYRLKQVDVDGKFSYSSVIQINGVQATGIKTWSIPGSNKVSVMIPQSLDGISDVMIYDAMGRMLQRKQVLSGKTDIDLGIGVGGVYFIKIVKGVAVVYTNQFIM